MAVDSAGFIYIVGNFMSSTLTMGSTSLTCDNTDYSDIFLAKIDPSTGSVIMATSYKGTTGSTEDASYDAEGKAVASDSSSMIYIAGTYMAATLVVGSTVLTNTASSGVNEGYIARVLTVSMAVMILRSN